MAGEKKCFVIMPITTPDGFLEEFRDGKEHFEHVLNCLFIPSIEKAGYRPIPPSAKGADLIHANIITNLEKSELVLCDMSCLNPNVFFEFGIRTSLNKSVCVVKDDIDLKVPFDTGILNFYTYRNALEPWEIDTEIKQLSKHIKTSAERSKGENTLWKYFGMRTTAAPYDKEGMKEDKLEYLSFQIDSIREKMDHLTSATPNLHEALTKAEREKIDIALLETIRMKCPDNVKIITHHFNYQKKQLEVYYYGEWNTTDMSLLQKSIYIDFDIRVNFLHFKKIPPPKKANMNKDFLNRHT